MGTGWPVIQNVIDYTETVLGILSVVCEFSGKIDLQIIPRWSISRRLDRLHGSIANVVIVVPNDDNSLNRLLWQDLSRQAIRMAIFSARLTNMK